MTPSPPASRARGFTLVEVLVARFAMALLSVMAWQGLESVLQAREASRGAVERAGRLATVLTQWEQDLQAVADTGVAPALQFDGQTVRLTRRGDAGVVVVAWAVRNGRWQRWSSPAFTGAEALQQGWLASQQLLGTEPGQVTLAEPAEGWQVYFFYDGNWANAQSTGNLAQAAVPPPVPPSGAGAGNPPGGDPRPPVGPVSGPRQQLPGAVRIVVTLDGRTLTRDIALGPTAP
ncbi:MAG: type II secretion system protein J [Betaproteobacteria bacterium]